MRQMSRDSEKENSIETDGEITEEEDIEQDSDRIRQFRHNQTEEQR